MTCAKPICPCRQTAALKSTGGEAAPVDLGGIVVAQTQKMVGKLNFARADVTGGVGRVVLRPLYDFAGGGWGKWTFALDGQHNGGYRFRHHARRG